MKAPSVWGSKTWPLMAKASPPVAPFPWSQNVYDELNWRDSPEVVAAERRADQLDERAVASGLRHKDACYASHVVTSPTIAELLGADDIGALAAQRRVMADEEATLDLTARRDRARAQHFRSHELPRIKAEARARVLPQIEQEGRRLAQEAVVRLVEVARAGVSLERLFELNPMPEQPTLPPWVDLDLRDGSPFRRWLQVMRDLGLAVPEP